MIFRKEGLTRAIEAVVAAGGSEPREAKAVAENLVMANLLGHDSHGIGMIPRYINALLEGGLAVNQHPRVTLDTGALLALDGCKGYGQTIGHESMEMAIERAKRHGSCAPIRKGLSTARSERFAIIPANTPEWSARAPSGTSPKPASRPAPHRR